MNTTTPPTIEIFKPGSHTDANSGESITFSESDVAATVAGYDPDLYKTPLVIGHPKAQAPAMGLVVALSGAIEATTADVDAKFAEAVNSKRFNKISTSFYRPESNYNPKPGIWYPRHVGFFGAHPVSVKGMREPFFDLSESELADLDVVEFAEGETADDFVEFSESMTMSSWSMSRFFRGLREYFIEQHGKDKADEVVPSWMAEEADDAARSPEKDESTSSDFSEPNSINLNKEVLPVGDQTDTADFAEQQAKIDKQKTDLDQRQAKMDADAQANREKDNADFCEANVAKIPGPERQALALAVLNGLSDEGVADFAEKGAELSPLDGMKKLIEGLPDVANFSEVIGDEELPNKRKASDLGVKTSVESEATHQKALDFMEKHEGTDYVEAVEAVS